MYFHSIYGGGGGEKDLRPPAEEPLPDYDDDESSCQGEDSERKISAVSIESSADLQVLTHAQKKQGTLNSITPAQRKQGSLNSNICKLLLS